MSTCLFHHSVLDPSGLRRHGAHHDGKAPQPGERHRVVLEEPEHALLGHRLHQRGHARGGREEVPGHRHQGEDLFGSTARPPHPDVFGPGEIFSPADAAEIRLQYREWGIRLCKSFVSDSTKEQDERAGCIFRFLLEAYFYVFTVKPYCVYLGSGNARLPLLYTS